MDHRTAGNQALSWPQFSSHHEPLLFAEDPPVTCPSSRRGHRVHVSTPPLPPHCLWWAGADGPNCSGEPRHPTSRGRPQNLAGEHASAAAGVGAGLGQVYVGEDMSTETNRGRQLWRAVPA